MNDLRLMAIRADTLFVHDARGRMVETNEPREDARRPAPRLFLGRTVTGDVVRFGAALPESLEQRLAAIVSCLPPVADLQAPLSGVAELSTALEADAPIEWESGGPLFRFPASTARLGDPILVAEANRGLLRETFPWLERELPDWQPCFAVTRGGEAVSVCFSARLGSGAAEAGVETLPDFRGCGFAADVVAAWAAAIRNSGRVPLYSTDWENRASRAVARRRGLIQVGADATWTSRGLIQRHV